MMRSAGKTYLRLIQGMIYFLALCSSLGLHAAAESFFAFTRDPLGTIQGSEIYQQYDSYISSFLAAARDPEDESADASAGQTSIGLQYREAGATPEDGIKRIYIRYYLLEENGLYGLEDSAHQQILACQYQDIIPLPYAFALKENELWRFYDRASLQPLTLDSWTEVHPERTDKGEIITGLIAVRDAAGNYGAVNQLGEVVVAPRYQLLELGGRNQAWPLHRIRLEGLYGFLELAGEIAIEPSWAYAELAETTLGEDGTDAEWMIFVYDGESWGAIRRSESGAPSAVDWQIMPPDEVAQHAP